jgi:cellulose synthase operon protein C
MYTHLKLTYFKLALALALALASSLYLPPPAALAQPDDDTDDTDGTDGTDGTDDPSADSDTPPAPALDEFDARLEHLLGTPFDTPPPTSTASSEEFETFRKAARNYLVEVKLHRQQLDRVVQAEFQRKQREIDLAYKNQIDATRDEERSQRDDAIRRLERFLEKHPQSPTYTPSILYRLSILHYEKADYSFFIGEDPTQEFPDFSRSIHYSQRLISEYPDFPQLDGVYYLHGFCLQAMNRYEEARDVFLALTEKYPKSKKAPEAYTRIGEFYFDQSQESVQGMSSAPVQWNEAKKYYTIAIEYGPDYAIYDRALYRLAWTNYYKQDYDSMIKGFITLVEFSDRSPKGSSLRKEAVEFMASVLAEEDWNLEDDITTDPNFGMPRFDIYLNQGRPFELEVLEQFAEILAGRNHYRISSDAFAALLQRNPCNPKNPEIHEKYIATLNLSGQRAKAIETQANLDTAYGKGSEWYLCQEREGNFEAIAYADTLARTSLSNSFKNYHARANDYANKALGLREIASLSSDQHPDALRALFEVEAGESESFVYGLFIEEANCHTVGFDAPDDASRYLAQADCLQARSQETYKLSASTIATFIQKYPNDPDIYVYRYIYADDLFRSHQLAEAAVQFDTVRDISDGRYRRDSANGAIEARTLIAAEAIEQGTAAPGSLPPALIKALVLQQRLPPAQAPSQVLSDLKTNHADDLSPDQLAAVDAQLAQIEATAKANQEAGTCAPTPLPLSPEALQIIDSRERYISYDLDSRVSDEDKLAPEYAFLNALIFFNHAQYPEAIARLQAVRQTYGPSSPFFKPSAEYILQSYFDACDYDRAQAALENNELAGLSEDQKGLLIGGLIFQKANLLFKQGKFAQAAIEYERVVNENPNYENIHIALYNAGVAYENIKRYESAMRLYNRIYTEYNQTEEAMDALYRVAFNGERFFDFDTAVSKYIELHDSKREHPKKSAALKRAAIILKYNESYDQAATLFLRYHATYPEQEDAPALMYEAALMYEKLDNISKMTKTFEDFRKKYGSDPNYLTFVLESYTKQADLARLKGNERNARTLYGTVLREYQAANAPTGVPAYFAAKAQFMLADLDYDTWAAITPGTSLRTFEEGLDKKIQGEAQVAALFAQVTAYQNVEWSMAALFRVGSMKHNFAKVLANAQCPRGVDQDTCDGVREGLIEQSLVFIDQARQYYEKVDEEARRRGLTNEWSKRALNGLNDIDPKQYPIFEGERSALRPSAFSPVSTVSPASLDQPPPSDDSDDTDNPTDNPTDTTTPSAPSDPSPADPSPADPSPPEDLEDK